MIQITGVRHDWPIRPGFCLTRQNGHADYTFLHFEANEDLQINGKRILVPRNSCIVYKPGTPQHFFSPSGMLHDWFHFIYPPEGFFEELGIVTDELFFPNQWSFITSIVAEVENEFYQKKESVSELIDIKIRELFIKISRSLKNDSEEPIVEEVVYKFRNLRKEVMRSLAHNWTVWEMASRLYLSPSRFSHIYKKIYGTTPIDDLIHARIDHAKNALIHTDKTIDEIAVSLGYNSTAHFCRQFHQLAAVSPSQYRRIPRQHFSAGNQTF